MKTEQVEKLKTEAAAHGLHYPYEKIYQDKIACHGGDGPEPSLKSAV